MYMSRTSASIQTYEIEVPNEYSDSILLKIQM
jgi:hypothetical protein